MNKMDDEYFERIAVEVQSPNITLAARIIRQVARDTAVRCIELCRQHLSMPNDATNAIQEEFQL